MDRSIDSVNDEHPKTYFYSESTSLSLRFDLKNVLKLRLALNWNHCIGFMPYNPIEDVKDPISKCTFS